MKIRQNQLFLSATDLANHLSCPHLTALNLQAARGDLREPEWQDPHAVVLRQRGLEHEAAYVNSLRGSGIQLVDLSGEGESGAREKTREAIEQGAGAIYQGGLASGEWSGRPDILLRVERPDGAWSYEVVDCKLSSATKAETILQLCLYSELLAEVQGVEPEFFQVIRPNVDFVPEMYRVSSFAAYFRQVKRQLKEAVQADVGVTYPEPVEHCEMCRWWKRCDTQRRRDDHLAFVAGASKIQRKELVLHEIQTLAALAQMPLPVPFKPDRGSREGYARIREQARIQNEARTQGQLKFELLEREEGKGLYRLPAPSPGDMFLDFEGDPFVNQGGLEYVTGVLTVEEGPTLVYQGRWALDRAQERAAFEWLIDLAFERRERFPEMHIYHFGAYEPGAVKRLMLRYATREEKVDQLLRGEAFVDLHMVVKQSLRASVEQYSLKDLERFTDYQRDVPLADASRFRHVVEHQLELSPAPVLSDEARTTVQRYNEDDCRATERLRHWLEGIRAEVVAQGIEIPRPAPRETQPTEEASALQQRVDGLFAALTQDLPEEPTERTPEQAGRWLLAHALGWHLREDKVKWWEFFRMKDLTEEELYDEKTALAGLTYVERLPPPTPRSRAAIDRYAYPVQECSLRAGDKVYTLDEQHLGEVVGCDADARTIDVKKRLDRDGVHPESLFAHTTFGTKEQTNAVLRLADWIVANGIDGPGEHRAARDLLMQNKPRLRGASLTGRENESITEFACRAGVALDDSILPIQGPPGSGKTYTGARMICELIRSGKKVGITAVGHKVIRNLLDKVVEAAAELGVEGVACGHKNSGGTEEGPVREIGSNQDALALLESGGVNVLGGTSWMWAREEFAGAVDVLFVDEAGQMSLASVLAAAAAGRSLVLLGDPQQLEQPQKGSHPEGSDVSALAHLLGGGKTMSSDRGLFLAETWRLHPAICGFTSELFYEDRLVSVSGLERQSLSSANSFSGSGLWFVPARHDGNQSRSDEEVELVASILADLTAVGATWTDREGVTRPMDREDILVVAPYNDQVNRLKDRLPEARVGTVDKFQGQEAAVVVYSMTSSSPEDAPRGMEFLYNLNRFNVATSRARCACIVVGSPRLFSPGCRRPRQMELANAVCRYLELSSEVRLGRVAAAGRAMAPAGGE